MIKAKLVKQSGNGKSEVRNNEIEGEYENHPEVGKSFVIFGKPLTQGAAIRVVMTSPVKSIDNATHWDDDKIVFKTENSTYFLTIQ